jgi:hypothetical protein
LPLPVKTTSAQAPRATSLEKKIILTVPKSMEKFQNFAAISSKLFKGTLFF